MGTSERRGSGWSLKLKELKEHGRQLKIQILALGLAYRDPRTPWYAKLWAMLVVAYAISPIDLIPDFVPVVGYLDDLILVPLGVAIALKMIPPQVWKDAREQADQTHDSERFLGWAGAILIVMAWLLILAILAFLIFYRKRG